MPRGGSASHLKKTRKNRREAAEAGQLHANHIRTPASALFQRTPEQIIARVEQKARSLRRDNDRISQMRLLKRASEKILGHGFLDRLDKIQRREDSGKRPKSSMEEIVRTWMKEHGVYKL